MNAPVPTTRGLALGFSLALLAATATPTPAAGAEQTGSGGLLGIVT